MDLPERRGRLLIVDDEEDSLTPLCDILTEWGYETVGFTSGENALKTLKEHNFDLLISDLIMPEMDGIKLLKAARQIDPHLMGIITTGRGTIETAIQAMKGGAFDYILKPIEWKLLKLTLSRAMEVRRLQRAEEKYRTIVEDQIEFICRWRSDGTITFINEVYCRYLGKTFQELIGEVFPPFTSESARADLKKEITSLDPENPMKAVESCFMASNGEVRWQQWVNRAIFDEEGLIEFQSVGRDVTDRKKIETLLYESEERYRSLFNNMLDGFAYCRMLFENDLPQDFIYLAVNSAFGRLTGLKNVVGKRATEVIPGIRESNPELFEIYGRVALTGRPERFETYLDALGIWLSIAVYCPGKGHFVAVFDNVTRRKETERALIESERKYRELVENANSIIMRRDTDGKITFFNEFAQEFFGYSEHEILGKNVVGTIVPAVDRSGRDLRPMIKDIAQNPEHYVTNENENMRSNGERVWLSWTNKAIRDETGRVAEILCVGNDITDLKHTEEALQTSLEERKKLESQLVQAQKIEAIGTLAGGVAHDFNNILTAIMTYLNILLMKMDGDDPLRVYVSKVLESSEKAAALVQRLLAFSRKQVISPKPVDINNIVRKMESLLMRLIGEDIELKMRLTEKAPVVMADSGQMEQVLMNLAVNARDAMPDAGTLTITTDLFEMDDKFIKIQGYGEAGKYALLTVSDTGEGMDQKTRERIFEPFFTTKEVGKGTGLGLAMVYGIVKQHNGFITCYSERDGGTAFRIYLPLVRTEEVEDTQFSEVPALITGTETILLAEDNADVRTATKEILAESGYTVIEAEDGEDAICKFMETENRDRIKLLILDVIMPKKNGKEVCEVIRKVKPGVRVLFSSGYSADIINKKGILEEGTNFILKPFSPHDFLRRVREVLDKK